jgi:hypothetical protein
MANTTLAFLSSFSDDGTIYKAKVKIILSFGLICILSYIHFIFFSDISNWNSPNEYKGKDGKLTYTDHFYFNCTTWFTVGFGDFTPKNKFLKLVTCFSMFLAFYIMLL